MPAIRYWVWARFVYCVNGTGLKQFGINAPPIWWERGMDMNELKQKFLCCFSQRDYENLVWFKCEVGLPATKTEITEAEAWAIAGA